ncbi:hypothetical protein AS9A_1018 [Hoyosella subflava DQS3-9A1]|uniref:Uncharacterized protein n=1 Tax=Hoyosella subflava (strain DSM 45089 / JCM 17490 / NBRC 109087 / DQS3-9A1) TaxID=443218 RepID=F6EQ47_HOYSD|nr:hypothetical protein AS9A_1018 [Hoyosella subflava DQS3-9A1]
MSGFRSPRTLFADRTPAAMGVRSAFEVCGQGAVSTSDINENVFYPE